MIVRHIRRPQSSPDGPWWLIRCDCGWKGQTPDMGRKSAEIDASLEQLYRGHLAADEARTYLLVDSRTPQSFQPLEVWLADAADPENAMTEELARQAFASQPTIEGVFVMPWGEPTVLVAERVEDGVHIGSYRMESGELAELPIGEVRTPDGRVFRLGQ